MDFRSRPISFFVCSPRFIHKKTFNLPDSRERQCTCSSFWNFRAQKVTCTTNYHTFGVIITLKIAADNSHCSLFAAAANKQDYPIIANRKTNSFAFDFDFFFHFCSSHSFTRHSSTKHNHKKSDLNLKWTAHRTHAFFGFAISGISLGIFLFQFYVYSYLWIARDSTPFNNKK